MTLRRALLMLLLLGCSHPTVEAPHAVTTSTAPSADLQTPLVVHWTAPDQHDGTLNLIARLERRSVFNAPLAVTLKVPAGLVLEKGPASLTVPTGAPSGTDEIAYSFRYEQVPTENLEIIADVQTSSWGAHATDIYRFGRPAPQTPVMPREGPEVKLNGANLGRSFMMPPPKKE